MPANSPNHFQSSNIIYPYGSLQPGRHSQTAITSRYGFNGMEKDNELKGDGNSFDFGARMYDSRVGRWLRLDPLAKEYPSLSDYVFVGNNPIWFIDPDGKKIVNPNSKDALYYKAVLQKTNAGKVIWESMVNSPNNIELHVYTKNETGVEGSKAQNVAMAAGYDVQGMVVNDVAFNKLENGGFLTGEDIRAHMKWDEDKGMFVQKEESANIHIVIMQGSIAEGDNKNEMLLYAEEAVQSTQQYLDYGPKSRVLNEEGKYEFNEKWYEGMTEEEIFEYYENEFGNEKDAKAKATEAAEGL